MPKIKAITSKKLNKVLIKKGFKLDHSTGSHFIFYHEESRRRVVVPMHNKDLPIGTLLSILKQAEINKDEL